MRTLRLLCWSGLALLAGMASPAVAGVDGKVAKYKFKKPLVNGRGISSLKELRGKPVLIDFWGTR